jgi:hypothetical protein
MSKWLSQFLENESVKRSDKSDRFEKDANLSGLSGGPSGLLDEKKVENNLRKGGHKSDRFRFEPNMSPLSLRLRGLFDEKMEKVENNPRKGGDKSDRFKLESNMSPLSLRSPELLDQNFYPYGEHDFEERLAIAEYDGDQIDIQAQRIAYLDAFISALTSLPATETQRDWLDMRIQTCLAWIEGQKFPTLN